MHVSQVGATAEEGRAQPGLVLEEIGRTGKLIVSANRAGAWTKAISRACARRAFNLWWIRRAHGAPTTSRHSDHRERQ